MERRKNLFKVGTFWHLCNKSIANYGIFKDPINAQRFIETLDYYNSIDYKVKYSLAKENKLYNYQNLLIPKNSSIIKVLTYSIMPDHYHLVTKVMQSDLISKYISDVENSFTHFFNKKFKRKGPLWQSRFRSILIKTNEQLLHVIRYVCVNPTTSNLVEKPEDWHFSSYKDTITNPKCLKQYLAEIFIKNPRSFKKFVEDNIDYQKKLKLIKKLLLE